MSAKCDIHADGTGEWALL